MKNKGFFKRTIAALGVAAMMVGMMPITAMADDPVKVPTDTQIDTNQLDQALITVAKKLKANVESAFPTVESFAFELTPVKFLKNQDVTAITGPDAMPLPTTDTAKFIKTDTTTVGSHKTLVATGGTFNINATTTSTYVPDVDTTTLRQRTNLLDIKFTEAGAYMYKLKELGAVQSTSNFMGGTENPSNTLSGIDFDPTEYYVVVYVVNQTEKKTVNGVTSQVPTDKVVVKNVTAWNSKATGAPTGANKEPQWDDLTITDNGNVSAGSPTGRPGVNDSKVGFSGNDITTQNELSYPFLNEFSTVDLTVTKTVTGDLGDKTQHFKFIVAVAGAEKGRKYTVSYDGTGSETLSPTDTTHPTEVTATSDGAITLTTNLKHGETFTIKDLPTAATYTVTEAKIETANEKHTASYDRYTVDGDGNKVGDSIDTGAAANAGDALATATAENKNALNKKSEAGAFLDQRIDFTNNRVSPTLTGVLMQVAPYVIIALAAIAGLLLIFKKKNRVDAGRY